MRNIVLVDTALHCNVLPCASEEDTYMTVDADNAVVFCSEAAAIVGIDTKSGEVVKEINLKACGLLQQNDCVIGLHHRLDEQSLCIALSNGDLLNWSADGEVECMGCVGGGIKAMSWSPDGELLVIFAGEKLYILVCHSCDLEPLCDFPFDQSEFGEAELVTVGWGKKETQFHGSEGKTAAARKETVQSGTAEWDDGKPRIRWIGDGQYFAVSAIDRASCVRKIRVWTRDGMLHSTSQTLSGLEQVLDWRPSGNLLVSSQTSRNKHEIVFFERNGLRHGEFILPFSINTTKVKEVMWNSESTILAVWLEDLASQDCFVQLWTVNNYHWYLKQSLHYCKERRPVCLQWDVIDGGVLYMTCVDGSVRKHVYDWITARNVFSESNHEVAVVDGNSLLITPFRSLVIPPPMCAYSLELPAPVSNAVFSKTSNHLAILLSSGEVHIYNMKSSDKIESSANLKIQAAGGTGFAVKCELPQRLGILHLSDDAKINLCVTHFVWLSSSELAYVYLGNSQQHLLNVARIDDAYSSFIDECVMDVQPVLAMVSCARGLILQYHDGSVWIMIAGKLSPYTLSSGHHLVFPVPCPVMDETTFDGQDVIVGLSQRYRLFVNEWEISSNCTSFALHQDFLLLTTHSHTVRCINRRTPAHELADLSDGKMHIFDETVRRVERGSRVVTCITDDTKLVLQMPRGNLEVIHPRALVLASVRRYLDSLQYYNAFTLMHRHRINMNLLCDHNMDVFLTHVPLFIKQIDSVTQLNQFITDLHEENVTRTMYTAFYNLSGKDEQPSGRFKVDSVCDRLIDEFESSHPDRYFLCILTALVRKTVPQLEEALIRIQQLKDKAKTDEALKYMLFLVDVNELYDVALGTYNFDLVLMVAEKSQKDPKEYLMFLNEVRKMEENYRKYTIDRHLKRYSKALQHISHCVPEHSEELKTLVFDQKLYLEALQMLKPGSSEHTDVTLAFADFLSKKKKHEEAGILFKQANENERALECFVEASCWQQAVIVMKDIPMSKSEELRLYTDIADKLVAGRRHGDAATVLEIYASLPEDAISVLIKGGLWSEALRSIIKHDRRDFIETDMIPSVMDASIQMGSTIQSSNADLAKLRERFFVVQKLNKAKSDLIGDEFRDVDADLYSDTSSMTGITTNSSTYSRSTGRTSKNQRKAQRKKWSLKEGSKFEDLALLDEMKKLITQLDNMRDDMHSLLTALVLFGKLNPAAELQNSYSTCLAYITSLIPEVWSDEVTNSAAQVTGENSTVNSILKSMATLATNSNPSATQAEIEVKRFPVVSTDSTWKLTLLSPLPAS